MKATATRAAAAGCAPLQAPSVAASIPPTRRPRQSRGQILSNQQCPAGSPRLRPSAGTAATPAAPLPAMENIAEAAPRRLEGSGLHRRGRPASARNGPRARAARARLGLVQSRCLRATSREAKGLPAIAASAPHAPAAGRYGGAVEPKATSPRSSARWEEGATQTPSCACHAAVRRDPQQAQHAQCAQPRAHRAGAARTPFWGPARRGLWVQGLRVTSRATDRRR